MVSVLRCAPGSRCNRVSTPPIRHSPRGVLQHTAWRWKRNSSFHIISFIFTKITDGSAQEGGTECADSYFGPYERDASIMDLNMTGPQNRMMADAKMGRPDGKERKICHPGRPAKGASICAPKPIVESIRSDLIPPRHSFVGKAGFETLEP